MGGKRKYVLTIVVTSLISFIVAYLCMLNYVYKTENLGRLKRVVNMIEENYIGDFEIEAAEEKAIEAVISSIGDKYAAYYNEKNAKQAMDNVEGVFVGVGLEVFANTEENVLEVISAYEDTPAYRAGIKHGDIIYGIDGKKYDSGQLADAALYMRGDHLEKPVNSELTITVLRGTEKIDMHLKREKIVLHQIKTKNIDGILYIRCSGFSDNAYKFLKEEMKKAENEGIAGIVFDLRNNPGGELQSTIKMCDMFLDDGNIMYTMDSKGQKKYYNAAKGAYGFPIAVLINGASASASEIFAGTMQARKRGIVLGEKSFGKGVAQTLSYINIMDKSGGAIKLTTCKNYRPDGIWLNEGVTPDKEVDGEVMSLEEIENDAVFKAAVKELQK